MVLPWSYGQGEILQKYSQNMLIQQGLSHDKMSDKHEYWNIKSVTYR